MRPGFYWVLTEDGWTVTKVVSDDGKWFMWLFIDDDMGAWIEGATLPDGVHRLGPKIEPPTE